MTTTRPRVTREREPNNEGWHCWRVDYGVFGGLVYDTYPEALATAVRYATIGRRASIVGNVYPARNGDMSIDFRGCSGTVVDAAYREYNGGCCVQVELDHHGTTYWFDPSEIEVIPL